MAIVTLLGKALDSATQAAGAARLPGAVRDLGGAVAQTNSASELVEKAAGLMSAGSPLLGKGSAKAAQLSGLIGLAANDLGNTHHLLLIAAAEKLSRSNSVLKQSIGKAIGDYAQLSGPAQAALAKLPPGTAKLPIVQSMNKRLQGALPQIGHADGNGFLLELSTQKGQPFRFSLGKATYETLKRQTQFGIADQERLTRRHAEQATGLGTDKITLRGAIFLAREGAGHIDRLRAIGEQLQPLILTTGYGQHLGRWYLNSIDEEQAHLFNDGAYRKQTFSLEFTRYGEDYQNV